MNENDNNFHPLSTSVAGNKNSNKNIEMLKVTMQTSHKKNLENAFLEDLPYLALGQNVNKIEEENLEIRKNDITLFSVIFDKIEEEGKLEIHLTNKAHDERKSNPCSYLNLRKGIDSPLPDSFIDKVNIVSSQGNLINHHRNGLHLLNSIENKNGNMELDSSFEMLNFKDQNSSNKVFFPTQNQENPTINQIPQISPTFLNDNTPISHLSNFVKNNGFSKIVEGQQVQAQPLLPVLNLQKANELIIQPVDGLQSNNFYCINENGGRIGRHSNNEIVIFEESVSRHHAMIEFKNDKFWLVDIGSTTGTFIKLTAILILQLGMIIELGSNQFLVESIKYENELNGILTLKVIEGLVPGKQFVIQNIATIGRKGPYNTITFADDFHLSNSHAKIEYNDGCFMFEDFGSTNGYINLIFEIIITM